MQAGRPSSRAADLLEETRRTLSLLEGYGPECERLILAALRPLVAEEVGAVVPQEAKYQRYAAPGVYDEYHDPTSDSWVMAFPPKSPGNPGREYLFVRAVSDPTKAEAMELDARRGWMEHHIACLRLEAFVKLKEDLRVAIVAGQEDQNLYLPAKELIYKRMGEVNRGGEG